MSDEQEHNKTIMIRRPQAGATETPQPSPQPTVKKPEPKQDEASWLKTPLGIVAIVIGAVAVTFVLVKLTGK
ncbi:MAG: hypothetical protein SF172_13815 [Burkholderiales bacterium]|nr:hypothetical protein [Burkholderiales bacterium]